MWKRTYVSAPGGASGVAGSAAGESAVVVAGIAAVVESAAVAGISAVVESGGFVPAVGRSELGSAEERAAWEAGCTA